MIPGGGTVKQLNHRPDPPSRNVLDVLVPTSVVWRILERDSSAASAPASEHSSDLEGARPFRFVCEKGGVTLQSVSAVYM